MFTYIFFNSYHDHFNPFNPTRKRLRKNTLGYYIDNKVYIPRIICDVYFELDI